MPHLGSLANEMVDSMPLPGLLMVERMSLDVELAPSSQLLKELGVFPLPSMLVTAMTVGQAAGR